MTDSLTVLIVEDNPGDLFLCNELLLEIGLSSQNIDHANTINEFNQLSSERKYDIIFLDLFLPDSSGKDTFNHVKQVTKNAAIIVLSGLTDSDVSVYAVQSGAQDYLVKGEFDASLLDKSIIYAMERLRYMDLLEASQRQYKDLFMENPLPTLLVELSSEKLVMINKSAQGFYDIPEKDLLEIPLGNLIELKQEELDDIKNNKTSIIQSKQWHPSRQMVIVRLYFRRIDLESAPHWLVMLEDITERVVYEEEKNQLTNKVQDFERKKIAMELHDGIGQELTLLSLYLNQMESTYSDDKTLAMCKQLIRDTISQTRALTYSIDPPSLNEGLLNGLCAFFNRLSRIENVDFPFEVCGADNLKFDYETAYAIFRIVQEFVNNAIKYSKSSVIGCQVTSKGSETLFYLYDKGIGFDLNTIDSKGMGLNNIYERSKVKGFQLKLDSVVGEGTTMRLIVNNTNQISN